MTEPRKCRRKGCKQLFVPAAEDLLVCPTCRDILLYIESQNSGRARDEKEAQATTEFWDLGRPFGDYRIIDENGVETWASDLAKRYDRELRQRAGSGLRVRSLKRLWPRNRG